MPEILVLPSPATRRTYPLHLRIVCALVAKLADLQVSMQHAHTARLVRNFPARYAPVERVERMQVQGRLKGQMVQIPSFLLSPLLVAVVVAQASVSTVPMAGVVAVGHNLRRRL